VVLKVGSEEASAAVTQQERGRGVNERGKMCRCCTMEERRRLSMGEERGAEE